MARDTVEEASACTIRARFFDLNNVAVTPGALRYRLTDVSNCRTVVDWTDITPASAVDVAIDASSNAIYNRCSRQQEHVLTFQANYDTDTQFADEHRYVIENLKGFE